MSSLEVSIPLPFYLRINDSFTLPYEQVCKEDFQPDFRGCDVEITVSTIPAVHIDNSGWEHERSRLHIRVETRAKASGELVGMFAIRNCLEIANFLITAYQATTGEISNAGYITPIGTSDMQLYAEITVDGQDFRDRWPGHSLNTFPLSALQLGEFQSYISRQVSLPLSRVFLANARLSLELGQYAMAVVQSATAVDLRITQVIRARLMAAGWPDPAIKPYEDELTLGQKLRIRKTDPRSVEMYYGGTTGFSNVFRAVRDRLVPLRNDVVHHGYLPERQSN